MANIKSSIKRIDIANRNQEMNNNRKSQAKTAIKRFETAIEENNLEEARKYLSLSEKLLRKAQQKNVVHANKVNRIVGRLTKQYNQAKA